MISFLTIEDVNSAVYSFQGYKWVSLDTRCLNGHSKGFFDFLEMNREFNGNLYDFTVSNHSSLDIIAVAVVSFEGEFIPNINFNQDGSFDFQYAESDVMINIYYGNGGDNIPYYPNSNRLYLKDSVIELNYNELNNRVTLDVYDWLSDIIIPQNFKFNEGYNILPNNISGVVYVHLVKTDFKCQPSGDLIVGKVNKVRLNVDPDYLPNGALIGEYPLHISVVYGDNVLPVHYDLSERDYCFDLDLTEKETTGKVRFTVNVDANKVLNQIVIDCVCDTRYETIDTSDKLEHLFSVGGTGRLSADITLNHNLNVSKPVFLIGDEHTLDLNGYQFIINSVNFKVENTVFTNGENSIHQKTESKVTLNNCTFTNCTGKGSVIECELDLHSLENPSDFITDITDCTITNSSMAILHGGELNVTSCTVEGKITDKSYPYFLYQTDGNATILQSNFNITHEEVIDEDIEFNTCIFVCGEFAQINGLDHTELGNNNITGFINPPQSNQSSINVTYYYDLIDDYISLESDKGYCHSVSGSDFVFKTGVKPTRRS